MIFPIVSSFTSSLCNIVSLNTSIPFLLYKLRTFVHWGIVHINFGIMASSYQLLRIPTLHNVSHSACWKMYQFTNYGSFLNNKDRIADSLPRFKTCSHWANAKAKKIKEQSEEIKEKISKIQREFSLSLGVNRSLATNKWNSFRKKRFRTMNTALK